jgi:hypothetical protein
MTLDEINEAIEGCNKKLEDYRVQIEALSNSDDPSGEEVQSQFDYLMREIGKVTVELDNLISKIP